MTNRWSHAIACIIAALLPLAGARAQGRLISVLEGGYDLRSLAASAAAHIERLVFA